MVDERRTFEINFWDVSEAEFLDFKSTEERTFKKPNESLPNGMQKNKKRTVKYNLVA